MLPLWLPKCYHMVRSPSLSPIVLLSRSPSLSWPITGAVFDCGPDKWELYDLSPGLAVPSPGLILKPNSSPSPRLPPYHCTPHSPHTPSSCSCRGRLFSGRKWIAPRWAQEPERSWERGEPPSAGPACCQPPGECGRAPLWHTHQPLCPPPHRLTDWLPASTLGSEPGNRLIDRATATEPGSTARQPAGRAGRERESCGRGERSVGFVWAEVDQCVYAVWILTQAIPYNGKLDL